MIRHESPSHYLDERSALGPMFGTFKRRKFTDIFFPKVTSMFVVQIVEKTRKALAIKIVSSYLLSAGTSLYNMYKRIYAERFDSHCLSIQRLCLTHKSDLWVSKKDSAFLLALENIYIRLIFVGIPHDAVAVKGVCGFTRISPPRKVA